MISQQLQRRLAQLEASTGMHENTYIIEFYDISPERKLGRQPDPGSGQIDNRPVSNTIAVICCDSDGNGGPGPCYSAYLKRRTAEGKSAA